MAGSADDITAERLRELAGIRAPTGHRVVSLYLSLDPHEFPTPEARATEISSALDEADRAAREIESGLDHQGKTALRADIQRARAWFDTEFSAKGAHGLAVFVCGALNLLMPLRLPCATSRRVDVGEAPPLEPLASIGLPTRWVVLLVNRRHGRLFEGTRWDLDQAGDVYDWVPGRAREGGLSEANFQRGVDDDALHHFEHVSEAMLERLRRRPFDRLLVAAPDPEFSEVLDRQHPYVRERCAGRVDIAVESSNAEAVLEAAQAPMDADDAKQRDALLERLRARIGRGEGAVAGDTEVRDALEMASVEVLLYDNDADGTIEDAVRSALLQSSAIVNVGEAGDLGPLGHIAAILRF